MSTRCYATVRGSGIRVTALDDRGRYGDPITFATSKAVASIRVNEITDAAKNDTERNADDEARLRFIKPAVRIRSTVDITFTCVDPAIYGLVHAQVNAGTPSVESYGFAEGGFDEGPFGGGVVEEYTGLGGGFGVEAFGGMAFGEGTPPKPITGIEVDTRALPVSFALEVWSKLSGQNCIDGQRQWGYTLFQHLRGGRIGGFEFANGTVSFTLLGAQSRRSNQWGVGPYDLEGDFARMTSAVSRNNTYRQMLTTAAPPSGANGVETRYDVVSNGNAANPMPDPEAPLVLSGGGAITSPYIISGGRA